MNAVVADPEEAEEDEVGDVDVKVINCVGTLGV